MIALSDRRRRRYRPGHNPHLYYVDTTPVPKVEAGDVVLGIRVSLLNPRTGEPYRITWHEGTGPERTTCVLPLVYGHLLDFDTLAGRNGAETFDELMVFVNGLGTEPSDNALADGNIGIACKTLASWAYHGQRGIWSVRQERTIFRPQPCPYSP